ncbi:hypothetical protein E1A91_D05G426900v1 [Gossypium mustelinum]|uniref:NB-ARC domain-containing protein n=1 Tax=Gossypium mustelinum TaxID=34275 RepID=A0A5D2V7D8_GOSMU|nr:hypothetical protein E1A91_D05G426900v1 [Gossypium mustelinum]
MSVFGEAALSAFLELLSAKLLHSVLNFVADHWQVHQQLKLWQSILPEIKSVLNHAEEKQIKHEGVKNWLDDLQDLAYDVDDILDEFAYQELRLKLQKTQAQASTSKVQKLIPTCCNVGHFSPIAFMFNAKMISKIKAITDRLNSLNTRRSNLGLSEIMSQDATSKGNKPRLQPTSLMDGAVEYVGRANEKQEMLELLKSNNSDGVCVLSIVGMGGMGKTTLAQLVYNDPSIKESFDHKSWVCVSDDFDAVNITKTILRSLNADSHDESDLNLLQVKLKEKLSGKRMLLVLDDIWNESYSDWTILRAPFGAGTKIIVTTRLQKVSFNVDSVEVFYLDKLSHHDCLSIFAQHALKARNFDGHLQFKEIGENIVRRCNGLPLAAKAIGSLLRTVTDHSEWEKVYESEIWDLPEDPCGLIPALRLSYHYLPPHLKRCFAYCSIFPKDYEFEEEEIILLWRAEGFLQSKAKIQGKGLGNQYFQDLVSRSFFQRSSEDKSRFVMHDLMNDLAQLVAGEICCRVEGEKQQKFSHRSRHSTYVSDDQCHIVNMFEAFYQLTSLRTFLPLLHQGDRFYLTKVVLEDLLPSLSYLRVLSLSGYVIVGARGSSKTLILSDCRKLKNLPSKIGNLVNLHFLDIRGAYSIERMPSGFDQLTKLQIIQGCAELVDDCSSPAKELSSLQTLSLCDISKFNIPADRTMLRFGNSEHFEINGWEELASLSGYGFSLVGHRFISVWRCPQLQSLEAEEAELQPDKISRVESLQIGYCGRLNRLPQVLHEFTFLTVMEIDNCRSLVSFAENNLPPNLKKLTIETCENLEYLVDEKEDNKSMSSTLCLLEDLPIYNYPSLMSLSSKGRKNICNQLQLLGITDCSNLSSLFSNTKFPITLKYLTIRRCPMLEYIAEEFEESACLESIDITVSGIKSLRRGLDKLIHLQEIWLLSCSNIVSFEESGLLTTSFRAFRVIDCGNFGALPKCMASITSLRQLTVRNCSADISFPSEAFPANLTSLAISNAPKIYRSLVEWGLNRLTSLQELTIGGGGCSNLVSFPEEGIGMMLPPSLTRISLFQFENLEFMFSEGFQDLASLQELKIYKCPKLTSLPEKDMLRSLGYLSIYSCPLLKEECSSDKGREWSKISHIPLVTIDGKAVIPRKSD